MFLGGPVPANIMAHQNSCSLMKINASNLSKTAVLCHYGMEDVLTTCCEPSENKWKACRITKSNVKLSRIFSHTAIGISRRTTLRHWCLIDLSQPGLLTSPTVRSATRSSWCIVIGWYCYSIWTNCRTRILIQCQRHTCANIFNTIFHRALSTTKRQCIWAANSGSFRRVHWVEGQIHLKVTLRSTADLTLNLLNTSQSRL